MKKFLEKIKTDKKTRDTVVCSAVGAVIDRGGSDCADRGENARACCYKEHAADSGGNGYGRIGRGRYRCFG